MTCDKELEPLIYNIKKYRWQYDKELEPVL